MKYFIDTEFLEGTQNKTFLGINVGKTKPTIDLISIGIVSEDGREYYAISKDFNLKEAWNRFDWKRKKVNDGIPGAYKEYWIRDNVLKPIWIELMIKDSIHYITQDELDGIRMTYKHLKRLINKYGKSNKQIAKEVKEFCKGNESVIYSYTPAYTKVNIGSDNEYIPTKYFEETIRTNPEFYGYYSDYDWVVFCWLFGNMINLPNGFPMYCIDLKQTLDEKQITYKEQIKRLYGDVYIETEYKLKDNNAYPKQTNEHHALSDARWTKQLYEFLNKL